MGESGNDPKTAIACCAIGRIRASSGDAVAIAIRVIAQERTAADGAAARGDHVAGIL